MPNIPCPAVYPKPAPVFVLESPSVQAAANSVYEQKKAFDAMAAAKGSNKVYNFKTDRERMQWLTGLYGRTSQGLA
jgi:hypothetical protein